MGIEDFGLTQQDSQAPVDQKLDRTIPKVMHKSQYNLVVSATENRCMKKGLEKLPVKWQILSQANNLYTGKLKETQLAARLKEVT